MRGYVREMNGTLTFVDVEMDTYERYSVNGFFIDVTNQIIELEDWFSGSLRVAYSRGGREVLLPIDLYAYPKFNDNGVDPYRTTISTKCEHL